MTVLLWLAAMTCFSDSVLDAFVAKDTLQLRELLADAPTEQDSLIVMYRLYPLVEDQDLIAAIPTEPATPTAPSLAVLSALWAYRIDGASVLKKVPVAMRTMELLDRAMEVNRNDPFVLLVHGQSLLYRPRFAGGSPTHAAAAFAALDARIRDIPACGISPTEVRLWMWRALVAAQDPRAGALRAELAAQSLPPLFAEALANLSS